MSWKDSEVKIYTNGLYVVKAKLYLSKGSDEIHTRLVGKIIDIKNKEKYVIDITGYKYEIGSEVNFGLYKTPECEKPDFKLVSELRKENIDLILDGNRR